ncbi:carbohydrate ABC transporter permease [Leifsonia sp. NPDC077715]|uniref:carbohydrate ABC transporter permease n=1 Tax=Leifsonia sp. NPDC077715 TaxID=3155539 RepID=UPI003441C86D
MTYAHEARRRRGTGIAGMVVSRTLIWVLLLFMLMFFVVPVIWLVVTPTKVDSSLAHANPLAFGSFENIVAAWNHLAAFQDGAIWVWLRNSAFYSIAALLLTVIASVPAGYALAMTRFRGRRVLLSLTLLVMLMPGSALVLPIYLELSSVHLTGTPLSVILPFSFYPFGVYLTYIYYSTSVPKNLLDAARIDGCSEWDVFRRIAVPLAKPIIALLAFFSFVANWNNYFVPLVMLAKNDDYPIQLGLQELLSSTPAFNPAVGGAQLDINRPELALAVILAVLPVLVLFLFSQRTLVAGMLAGSSKE